MWMETEAQAYMIDYADDRAYVFNLFTRLLTYLLTYLLDYSLSV